MSIVTKGFGGNQLVLQGYGEQAGDILIYHVTKYFALALDRTKELDLER